MKFINTKYFCDLNYKIPNLIVITGQKCTLKCEKCANFSPFHDKNLNFYDIDLIIKDIQKILKNVHSINHLQLQGGLLFTQKY